jgi:hypothetical protein
MFKIICSIPLSVLCFGGFLKQLLEQAKALILKIIKNRLSWSDSFRKYKKRRTAPMAIAFLCIALVYQTCHPYDTPQFFKARHFYGEPRFEKPKLLSLDSALMHGKANKFFDSSGKTDCLTTTRLLSNLLDPVSKPLRAEFNFFEWATDCQYNLSRGFFLQAYLPVRSISISYKLPELYKEKKKETGLAQIVTLLGISNNYQETDFLDFIDTEAKAGVIWPTSPHTILGYGGHIGYTCAAALSLGFFDWLTAGTSCQCILFSPHAGISRSPLFSVGSYVKADHIAAGFSFLCGYAYDRQYGAYKDISSANGSFPWSMQTVQTQIEWDGNERGNFSGFRWALKYEALVAGKNTVRTSLYGGALGLDISFSY